VYVKKKISVGMLSLGCPKTLVDSELVLGLLDKDRYRIANQITDCDVALLNTCAFINEAKQESVDHILNLAELKKEGRIKALVVLGCLVQRYQKELEKELGEVDAILGTGDYQAHN
jgi:ribosomal protein S12 methylthiotransferase